jgi:hypothetical protein
MKCWPQESQYRKALKYKAAKEHSEKYTAPLQILILCYVEQHKADYEKYKARVKKWHIKSA